MSRHSFASGKLDEIAQKIGAKSDADLASFLGISEKVLESLRYGAELSLLQAAEITARVEAHAQAADLLKTAVAAA
ncbi:hypothetical protein [Corynebacterium glutamicum]|uniref:hypothetical protein n=1 Tax=Corynebacterium glutamicum TaxID=1718 RepID=UPI00094305A7|nr:hypothetical protein [Corynebacterium glutamicum]OKX85154.1 hypothetical protein AUO95_01060 [Corynebacterium glutamicum]